ncbi:MAG: class I SAM-dependent methyltransferase [Alphaproteobacteria bacterium]|nr:class I SAM-dependent methyltransferase [Alphaproteobacteria bacterium]
MYAVFDRSLRLVVKTGALQVIDATGLPHTYGDGTGTPVIFRVTSSGWTRKIATDPDLNLGEAYMAGGLTMEQGTIYDLLALLLNNARKIRDYPWAARLYHSIRLWIRRLDQYNPIGKAKANVAHHYDLSGALYDLFLDRDRQYSCAYFENEQSSLEDAQLAKKRHLAAKLDIKPGMKVLDIGSGWGGLGLYLAETCGARVTGVTLSEEQHKVSNERAGQRGVSGQVEFRLLDYRNLNEKFDRIVSVGMFEHVGIGHYREFFGKCASLLADDGIAVLHSINRSDGPGATSAWIKKYIFPGGYIPALSEVVPAIERAGLYITDIEILRLHYARTLREWARRFADHRERAKAIYDERFCRMWEFYLAASECAFRYGGMNNFQIQFTKNQEALPFTRNYMIGQEDALRAAEGKRPRFKSVQYD